jgi:hypothetical protein
MRKRKMHGRRSRGRRVQKGVLEVTGGRVRGGRIWGGVTMPKLGKAYSNDNGDEVREEDGGVNEGEVPRVIWKKRLDVLRLW